jgi:hypothetical protein
VRSLKYDTLTTIAVDASANASAFSSLVIDAHGRLHVGYFQGSSSVLKYATVDQDAFAGWFSTIGVDGDGRVRIAYYRSTDNVLKYIE